MTGSIPGGKVGAVVPRGRRLLVQVSLHECVGRIPSKGRVAGQALEEDAAERVDVGAGADGFPLDLFGGDVVDGAELLGSPGQRRSGGKLLPQAKAA